MNEVNSSIEFNTVRSVKKAIRKIEIAATDSKSEFDEIAISIKKIDIFYEEHADHVSPNVLVKLHNSINNVMPDFRAMILSFFVSIIVLVFPYLLDQLLAMQFKDVSFITFLIILASFYIALLVLLIGAVFALWVIATNISSGKNQIINDHHKAVLEQIIKKQLDEKCLSTK